MGKKIPVAMRPGETHVPIPNTGPCLHGELRPGRPMVLCWGRHGRAGGCRNTIKAAFREREANGDVAQLGEHLPCKQGVKGSNPSISIECHKHSECLYRTLKTEY